jgi:lipopolysaccharide biosynthesis glycosyltransferase
MNKVFIGWDSREKIAYEVCRYSIYKHNQKITVIPIVQQSLRQQGIYNRSKDRLGSTEFTFTRFLVPYLCNYTGWALFCDCDFLWTGDIDEVFNFCNDDCAVMVVKHNHVPKTATKKNDQTQSHYDRKNWSSLILWNCSHPSNLILTPQLINDEIGLFFHQFRWLQENEIGSLDLRYNFLIGHNTLQETESLPLAYHFTEGGPWLSQYSSSEFGDLWFRYRDEYAQQLEN